MTLQEHIDSLRQQAPSSHLEGDPKYEAKYMQKAAYRLTRTLSAIPVSSAPLRLLDIGATPFTIILKRHFPHYEVAALDLTDNFKGRCKAAGIELTTCNLDNGRLPFEPEAFDVVVFTEVLEHVFCRPGELLLDVFRILRQPGTLVLSVPNIAMLSNRIRLLCGRTVLQHPDLQFQSSQLHGHGHLHEYTRAELSSICRRAGFGVADTELIGRGALDLLRDRADRSIGRFIYYSLLAVAPAFRPIIQLTCRK